jgi:succinate-semialdehyde dehydrogenase/glutarate-semialdehyde dehydrogenase
MPILQTISPHTGQLIRRHTIPNQSAVLDAVDAAHQAQPMWGGLPLAKRTAILKDVAKAIEAHADELAQLVNEEMGKPFTDALSTDVAMAAGVFATVANWGQNVFSPQKFSLANGWRAWSMGRTHQQVSIPKGVVAVISPWNYPLSIASWGLAASLMAGNCAILKPSENTPACGEKLVELVQMTLQQHGVNEQVAQCLIGDGQVGQWLVDSDIHHLIFTGSTAVGQKLQQQLSQRNIAATLELGGSCPLIVLPNQKQFDEHLTNLAKQIVWGRCVNSGQTCAAIKRVIVPATSHDRIVTAIKQEMSSLQFDIPATGAHHQKPSFGHLGPLVSVEQRAALHRQVTAARQQGGRVVLGGELTTEGSTAIGAYYPPTLITHLPDDAPVLQEELFGPVLLVQSYQTVEEAITLANNTPYGLTASVFGPEAQAQEVATRLHAGLIAVNDIASPHYGFLHIPWQGWKASGNRSASHSIAGLQQLAEWHTIATNRSPVSPWLFKEKPSGDMSLGKGLIHWLTRPAWQQLFNVDLLNALFNK